MCDVLTPQVLAAARGRTQFLTLGVDLNNKRKMDRTSHGPTAELVAIVDVEKGAVVQWTGKSYPTSWQEGTLGPGGEPRLAPARLRDGARARSRVPRLEHVQRPGLGQHDSRESQAYAEQGHERSHE